MIDRNAIAAHVDAEPDDVDGLDELAFLLGESPDTLYSETEHDRALWLSLDTPTRKAIIQLCGMKDERDVPLGLMLDVARHIAPKSYVAVLAYFGWYADKSIYSAEERAVLRLRSANLINALSMQ